MLLGYGYGNAVVVQPKHTQTLMGLNVVKIVSKTHTHTKSLPIDGYLFKPFSAYGVESRIMDLFSHIHILVTFAYQ